MRTAQNDSSRRRRRCYRIVLFELFGPYLSPVPIRYKKDESYTPWVFWYFLGILRMSKSDEKRPTSHQSEQTTVSRSDLNYLLKSRHRSDSQKPQIHPEYERIIGESRIPGRGPGLPAEDPKSHFSDKTSQTAPNSQNPGFPGFPGFPGSHQNVRKGARTGHPVARSLPGRSQVAPRSR